MSDPCEFPKLLLDDTLDTGYISYNKDYFVEDPNNVNVFAAAITTVNTRLWLYDMVNSLGQIIAYYDMDSVLYIDKGTNTVETGYMLGGWSDELDKDDYIND